MCPSYQQLSGRYEPEPVPREDLRKIMEAGLAAPSGCNKQTVSLVAANDPALLTKLKAASPSGRWLKGRAKRLVMLPQQPADAGWGGAGLGRRSCRQSPQPP